VTQIQKLILAIGTAALVTAPVLQEVAHAQARRARRVAALPRPGGIVVAAYYRPLFLSPFYDPFYDPWWFPYRYGWFPPPGYGAYRNMASLRLQVSPRDTEVFVDGYYAGIVDDFDGMFQRLHLEPGEHDVTLYLAGHRPVTQKIFLQHDGTFRIRHTMEPLAGGEIEQPRPVPSTRPAPGERQHIVRARRDAPRDADIVRGDPSFGAIAIRVQPTDAEVLIDGERWEGPQDDEALVVQVAPGMHRIEVRKNGYRSYTAQVDVTAAETSPINISLPME
jgi:hypothetical protein